MDSVDPEEAIEYFRRKLDLTDADFDALDESARAKAFTVAGVANIDVVVDVHDALNRALELGTPFADFAAEVEPKLLDAWAGSVANPGWRTEVIFRTNTQKAYNAGRWKQHQEVLDEFPYSLLDVVEDPRTSDICSGLDDALKGMALPADDVFWISHTPPLHHSCRSTIIPLTEEQAEEVGIAKRAPKLEAAEGFGNAPTKDDWAPDPDDYPDDIAGAVQDLLDSEGEE